MKIHLAVDIADTVIAARQNGEDVEVAARASELLAKHPETSATFQDVAGVLAHELARTDPQAFLAPTRRPTV